MPLLDTRHKKKSLTITVILSSILVILLLYIGLLRPFPPEENGIAINFGTMDFGSGKVQPKEKIKSEPLDIPDTPNETENLKEEVEEVVEQEPVEEKMVAEEAPIEKVVTQESEESILIKQQKEAKRKADAEAKRAKAAEQRIAREKKEAEERKRAEQEAKKRELDALMGGIGKSDGTESGSEGDDNKSGDKGDPAGNPYATSYYGAPGSGNGTGGYGLNGRSLVSKDKVRQECNEEGRVVVLIIVDKNGKVIKATPGVKGTTNNAPCLLEPAKKTAFLHKWNLDAKAPSQQKGFIVVNFKLVQ